VDLVARWWNGQPDRAARRDIWLAANGGVWNVRARHGESDEVRYDFTREYEARAMVDRLIAAAPGRWKDITSLVRKPRDRSEPAAAPDPDE
jgi:asparagine synthetase B (glutamine-hydrolysing)